MVPQAPSAPREMTRRRTSDNEPFRGSREWSGGCEQNAPDRASVPGQQCCCQRRNLSPRSTAWSATSRSVTYVRFPDQRHITTRGTSPMDTHDQSPRASKSGCARPTRLRVAIDAVEKGHVVSPHAPRPVGLVAEASPRTALTLSRAETAPIQSVFRSAARRSSATSTEWVRAPDGDGDLFQALRT
jgi:hypothetical protein